MKFSKRFFIFAFSIFLLFIITFQVSALSKAPPIVKDNKRHSIKLTSRDLLKIPLNNFKFKNYSENIIDASGSDIDTLVGNFTIEVSLGIGEDIKNKDTAGSGLPNIVKLAFGLDVNKKDFDGDGYTDKEELLHGYDPKKSKMVKLKYDRKLISKTKGKIVDVDTKIGLTRWYVDTKGTINYLGSDNTEIKLSLRKLNLSSDGLPIPKVSCAKVTTNEQKARCFLNNFKVCKRDSFRYAFVRYEIIGKNNDGQCLVRGTAVKTPDGEIFSPPENIVGSSMECLYNNKKSFVDQTEDESLCSGTLNDFFKELDEKTERSNTEIKLPPLEQGLIDCDLQYTDISGRSSCLNKLFAKCTPGRVSYAFDPFSSTSEKGAMYYRIHGMGGDARHCLVEAGFYNDSKKIFENIEQTGGKPDLCDVSNEREFVSALSDAQNSGKCKKM